MGKKIVVQLSGGLGNQLFQYATAYAVAKRNQVDLVLDTRSGFLRDKQYKRIYELDNFQIEAKIATNIETLPLWIWRVQKRFSSSRSELVTYNPFGCIINETELIFLNELNDYKAQEDTWLIGYWQSDLYFNEFKKDLVPKLLPSRPVDNGILSLGDEILGKDSVAVGIRLYEESKNPTDHALNGALKSPAEINAAIESISNELGTVCFYLFCTHRSKFLEQLKFPGEVRYVTHDEGFKGTLNRLWLLTQCKHHIITNSSYYWWGAYLSSQNFPSSNQLIYAADNFVNIDGIPQFWKRF